MPSLKSFLPYVFLVFGVMFILYAFTSQRAPTSPVNLLYENDGQIQKAIEVCNDETFLGVVVNTATPMPSTPTAAPTPTPTVIDNRNFAKAYDYKPVAQKKGTVRIPILTYHHIGALPKASAAKPYFVTPEMFEKQLQYLKEKNYRVVTSQEFYDLLQIGKNPLQKTVMLTFDDGNLDNYTQAFPLLKKYGYRAVFYVSTNRLAISGKRLKEMADAGMDIQSHTANHLDLTKVSDKVKLQSEIAGSKVIVEAITGKTAVSVSYPGCVYNKEVVGIAVAAGYKFGVSCGKSIDHNPCAVFGLSRMHVYNDFENFKKRLSGIWVIP